MAGQSSQLSRKEAIMLQKKVDCGTKKSSQGAGSGSGMGTDSHGCAESPKTKP